jgi:hypothetical protein
VISQDHLPIQYHRIQTKYSKFIDTNISLQFTILFFSREQSVTTASSNFSDWPTSNGNNSGGRIRNNDDWNDKCPICFMIFPLNMIDADRHQHVNEHMVDDHHPDGVLV